MLLNPASQAQNFTLTFDSGDEIDTVSFNPVKISEVKLRELMLLSPYIVDYFDQLPDRDIIAARSPKSAQPLC
jgi:hypothetical protein